MLKSNVCVLILLSTILLSTGCGGGNTPGVSGTTAPSFRLQKIDGTWVDSKQLSGSPTVLNFWATWCAPCRREIPELIEFAESTSTNVVGISLDVGDMDLVKRFVTDYDMDYTVLVGGGQSLFESYGGIGIPHTVLLDSSWKVVRVYSGVIDRETLERDVQALIN